MLRIASNFSRMNCCGVALQAECLPHIGHMCLCPILSTITLADHTACLWGLERELCVPTWYCKTGRMGRGLGLGAYARAVHAGGEMGGLPATERAQQAGLVFQFPERHFLGATLEEELTFGWPNRPGDQGSRLALSMRARKVPRPPPPQTAYPLWAHAWAFPMLTFACVMHDACYDCLLSRSMQSVFGSSVRWKANRQEVTDLDWYRRRRNGS